MQSQTKYIIKLSALSEIPKSATITSKLDVSRFEKIAHISTKELPSIRVGKIGSKMYPISQLYVIQACKNAGVTEIQAFIEEYETKYDLLAAHVRLHSADEPINPLAIRSIVNEMGIQNLDSATALKELFLVDAAYAKIMTSSIMENAINELQKFVDGMSLKLSARNLVCPIYIILQIGKMAENLQLKGVEAIKGVTLLEADYRFIWPTPNQVEMVLSNVKPISNHKPAQLAEISESIVDVQENIPANKTKTGHMPNDIMTPKSKTKPNADTKTLHCTNSGSDNDNCNCTSIWCNGILNHYTAERCANL